MSFKRIRFVVVTIMASSVLLAATGARAQAPIPRTPDGRPDLQGIWQVRNRAAYGLEERGASYGILPGPGVVDGGDIPYQPWALERRDANFANRATADPLSNCYLPGVPRIMYMEHPFQIFQTPDYVALTFEWSLAYRLIYTNGEESPYGGIPFWMGDSRGRWEGDTLVVEVSDHNDRTWFDMSGNFHGEQLFLVERYTMRDPDTIEYVVTVEDPEVFTRPWTMRMLLHRDTEMDRLLEYHCQAEKEEFNGAFERSERTWYPGIDE